MFVFGSDIKSCSVQTEEEASRDRGVSHNILQCVQCIGKQSRKSTFYKGVVPELGSDEEEGGGGINEGVWVHARHDGQYCLVACHVGPAIKCPVGQGQLEEGD